MRSKPQVRITVGKAVAGATLPISVLLKGRTRTPIDAVEVRLRCIETAHGMLRGNVEHHAHLDEHLTFDGLVLGAGERHEIHVEIPLPSTAPPSYAGAAVKVRWTLAVQVVIPWWPDLRVTRVLDVARAPWSGPRPEATVACSHEDGPRPGRPYLEGTLSSTEVAPGKYVIGTVSLEHPEETGALKVALVATELGTGSHRVEAKRHEELVAARPSPGGAIPFEVLVPDDAVPSFRGVIGALEWSVEATVEHLAIALVRMPILVEPRPDGQAAPPARGGRALAIGRTRRAGWWAEMARQVGLSATSGDERLSGTIAGVEVELGVDGDTRATGALRWPSLGLGLTVKARRGIVGSWKRGVPIGPAWSEPFKGWFTVEVRDARQIETMMSDELQRVLVRAVEAGIWIDLDDDGATIELTDPPLSQRALVELVRGHLLPITTAVGRGLARVRPPTAMQPWIEAWRTFAESHGARLEPGRPFVHGAQIAGELVDVGLVWSARDEARGTRLALRLPIVLRQELRLDGDSGRDSGRLHATGRSLAAQLASAGDELRIGPSTIELVLPAVALDPRALLPLIDTMARLSRLLVGAPVAASPYR